MSFFDEIVEAYRYKVGPTKVEYMAAHKRYEAVRDEAAAELVKTQRTYLTPRCNVRTLQTRSGWRQRSASTR